MRVLYGPSSTDIEPWTGNACYFGGAQGSGGGGMNPLAAIMGGMIPGGGGGQQPPMPQQGGSATLPQPTALSAPGSGPSAAQTFSPATMAMLGTSMMGPRPMGGSMMQMPPGGLGNSSDIMAKIQALQSLNPGLLKNSLARFGMS